MAVRVEFSFFSWSKRGNGAAPVAKVLGLVAQAAVCLFLVRAFHAPGAAAAMLLGSLVVLVARGLFYRHEVQFGEVAGVITA